MWTVLLQLRRVEGAGSVAIALLSSIRFENGQPTRASDGAWVAAPTGWSDAPVATDVLAQEKLASFAAWVEKGHEGRYQLGGELLAVLRSTAPGAAWIALRRASKPGELRTLFELDGVALPIELLKDDDRPGAHDDFVFVRDRTVPARLVRGRSAVGPPPWPLRVLVVLGPGAAGEGIAASRERVALTQLLQPRRHDVDWRFLVCPTLEALGAALRDDPRDPDLWRPDVLHFMGHGEADGDQGRLIVGKPEAQEEWTARRILAHLKVPLRCVVLNACGTSSTRAMRSVAETFIEAGAASVVAMATDVLGTDAALFAEKLYAAYLDGTPIDESVQRARQALFDKDAEVSTWAIPQLFVACNKPEELDPCEWKLVDRRGVAGRSCEGVDFAELDRFVDQQIPRHRLARVFLPAPLLTGAASSLAPSAPALLVHGMPETGKHTIMKWMVERAFRTGWRVRFLDAEGRDGRRPGPDHWSQGSTMSILRRIRDGQSVDSVDSTPECPIQAKAQAHFRDFALVANHVLQGRRPPTLAGDDPVVDEGHDYEAKGAALPDWLERVMAAFRGGLAESAKAQPLLIVLHRVDHWSALARKEILEHLVAPLSRGAVPHVAVLVTDPDAETARVIPSIDRLELRSPNVANAEEAAEVLGILEDYLALGGLAPQVLPRARKLAQSYFDEVLRPGTKPFRLHRLPELLQAFRIMTGSA